jgi:hypothetical protein
MVVTHFVIDTVAGRESLLWRVFVPGAGARVSDRRREGASTVAHGRRVRYRLEGRQLGASFTTCVEMGCVLETGPLRAGDVASVLWDGRAIPLEVEMAGGRVATVHISAEGFRAALRELMRLRRIERAASRR